MNPIRCLIALISAGVWAGIADTSVLDAAEASTTNEDWQSEVFSRLEQAEYHASQLEDGLQAPNRAQSLRTYFRAGGIDVVPRQANAKEAAKWQFAWRTSKWGREGQLTAVSAASGEPRAEGARVTYSYEGFDEWYENKKEGLEQGFTVHERPAGAGPLVISGRIDGGLRPTLSSPDGAVDLLDEHGSRALRYGELHVWDAHGTELASRLTVNDLEIAIVIDDTGAEYPLTIDPLMTSPAWTAEGVQATANFGYSVATAGDVNGDGFSDVIVGAWKWDNGHTNEGGASVYLGSPNGLSINPSWTAEGEQANANFGTSVASAGDVNGDGFSDVIVGAPFYAATANNKGRAFMYLGSASGLAATPAWTVDGGPASDLGRSVAAAGDVNGDGFSDVIVGAWQANNGHAGEGQAFVYHGSASGLASTPSWTGESNQAFAFYGWSVATAGDVNADGFADVIVGAISYDNGQTDEGRAFVYHGSASGLALTPAWTGESDQASASYGWSVATAGDIDGDGYCDVIVGAISYDNGQESEGRAYVYGGSPLGLAATPELTLESNQASAEFGVSVATVGDVNGDGFADVIIGADLYDAGQTNEGRAFVYHGSATGLLSTPAWTGESDQGGANFGLSVATAGDVNGDGYSDVIVGSWQYDNGQTDEGRAFVYHGSAASPATAAAWTGEGNQLDARFGWSVATAGDVNGDGYSDVIVGASLYDNGQADEGRAFVFHGSAAGLVTTPVWTVEGEANFAELGTSVATAGDVNGDGYSDVVVGVPFYGNPQQTQGRVYVYHGSASGLAMTPSWTAMNDRSTGEFGYSVATAGDVNGDGYSDIIVGARTRSTVQVGEGTALVYHGSSSGLSTTPDWTRESNVMNAHFGHCVSTAGDVNGDGYSDVVVGAPDYNGNGRADVYHGSSTGLNTTPGWFLESAQAGSVFGRSVASAGDVNADGFSDVIVGAEFYSNGQSLEGRAFLYQGSAAGLATSPAWTAEGNQDQALFGTSVATAGDVNGDGFSDVIVGAPWYNNGQNFEGLAFVYPGSAAGLSLIPSWTGEINQENVSFGRAVSAGGDVNGDGYSDVIVGSPFSSEGAAFLYYGNGGDGLDRIPHQKRTDGAAPIEVLGLSDSPSEFGLEVLGRTPAGRGRVRLQVEVKPYGTPFNGAGLTTGAILDTGLPAGGVGSAVALSELVSGLNDETLYHWRLRILSDSPLFPHSPWLSHPGNAMTEADVRTASSVTGVAVVSSSETGRWLQPSAPNPFVTSTRLRYAIPERGRVRLAIYDVSGRKVTTLSDEVHEAGTYELTWDGRDAGGGRVPSGVYFARLALGERVEARKIVLSR